MKKNNKITKKSFSILSVISALIIFLFSYFSPTKAPIFTDTALVKTVVDGDTLKVEYNGKIERVRMLGIDTPESVHPDASKNTQEGKIASNYTKKLLENKSVKLEFGTEKRDKYNRILAYVWLDDELINLKLVSDGYAKVFMLKKSDKYYNKFITAENEAKLNKKGIWK